MAVNFSDDKSRKDYLLQKFDDLLAGINNQYGRELMDELINRLERTINIFHQEVEELIGELKQSYQKKEVKIREMIQTAPEKRNIIEEDDEEKVSDWEKKLEEKLERRYQ